MKESRRVPPVILVADDGYFITTHAQVEALNYTRLGTHGYDNTLASMQAIFVAEGKERQDASFAVLYHSQPVLRVALVSLNAPVMRFVWVPFPSSWLGLALYLTED